MTKINLIAAAGIDNTIGAYGSIPWRMPEDMKHFRKLTMGHTVVMGRKTFESMCSRPLNGRKSIVLTSKIFPNSTDVTFCKSTEEVNEKCKDLQEIFIIGGSEIYNQYIEKADKIYLTKINYSFNGDTFFPEINEKKWKKIDEKRCSADDYNPYNYSFIEYIRI